MFLTRWIGLIVTNLQPFILGILLFGLAASPLASATELADGFVAPPVTARPTCYWWWLRTPTTKEAITKDLEAMKSKGLSGAIICDWGTGGLPSGMKMTIGDTDIAYTPTNEFEGGKKLPLQPWVDHWTPEWREMVRHACGESSRLGLELGIGIGPGALLAEFVTAEKSQQVLVWSETPVTGGQTINRALPLGVRAESKRQPSSVFQDVAVLAVPVRPLAKPEQVVDLSTSLDASGKLQWEAPPGNWTVLRFSQVPNGRNFMGCYYVDMLNADALHWFWDRSVGLLLKEMTRDERKGLVYIADDSWEGGAATWTKSFLHDFERLRGYDLKGWMPVLAGKVMVDQRRSDQVRRDYRLTISDLIAEHYELQRTLSHAAGLKALAEACGPHQHQADLLKSQSRMDDAMGEFWAPSQHRPIPEKRFLARTSATAAHVYGLKRTLAEAFTSYGPQWEESPFLLKPVADQAFCDGVNWICLHSYSHSPQIDAKPGPVYGAGSHFERGNTWWKQSGAFFSYLSRCSYLLQQGRFVADVVYYLGDDAIGQSAQMKDQQQQAIGSGYDYDYANEEVLLTRMSVQNGRIVLADGMNYRVLVLPSRDQPFRLAALKKIAEMVEAGATVVGPKPEVPSGLRDDPVEFRKLANRLWGAGDGKQTTERKVGQGHVIWGPALGRVLDKMGVSPDFDSTGVSAKGVIDWIHRSTDTAEIYYVTSRWVPREKITATFRVIGRQPELWDPVTGQMRDAVAYRQERDRTIVPLEFDAYGSVFVVFRRTIPVDRQGTAAGNYPVFAPMRILDGPWTVAFDPKWGGPDGTVTFQTLDDWTLRPEVGIKYFSGTAIYTQSFDIPEPIPSTPSFLNFGIIKNVASVRLNGKDLGIVWTAPWRAEVTGLLRVKGNRLEISVTNLWPNRLIGDEFLPESQRFTVTNIRKYTKSSQLLPSGLLGPVTLESATCPK